MLLGVLLLRSSIIQKITASENQSDQLLPQLVLSEYNLEQEPSHNHPIEYPYLEIQPICYVNFFQKTRFFSFLKLILPKLQIFVQYLDGYFRPQVCSELQ